MKNRNHAILILIVFCAWLTFYLIGIPSNYFQDWSTAEQILLSLITVFAGVPLIAFLALIIIGENYLRTGIWLAFYASVPLAIIDFIVCGIIQKGGLNFFISHWYVTLGYFYVWMICPLVGFLLNRLKNKYKICRMHEHTTMYKNNSQGSSILEGNRSLQLSCNLKGMNSTIGYYSYIKR